MGGAGTEYAVFSRMLLAIKRDGTVKCRLVKQKQGFKENLLEVDGPDFLYSSNVVKLHTVRMLLSRRRSGAQATQRRIAWARTPYPRGH